MLRFIKKIHTNTINRLVWFIVFILMMGWLMSIAKLFLARTSVNFEEKNYFVDRHLYKLSALFFKQKIKKVESQPTQTITPLRNWTLSALYARGKDGFIVVVVGGRTYFLNIQDTLQGYKLMKIEGKNAFLQRNNKLFQLSLSLNAKSLKKIAQSKKPNSDIANLKAGIITREEINKRLEDPSTIWSEISIYPFLKDGVLSGFRIDQVRRKSIFEHMGLRSGDIIVAVDGDPLNDVKKVQYLYKNIDNIRRLTLKIKRAEKTMELHYEIK